MALRTLAETHLGAASSLCIWGDKRTFRKHTKVSATQLSFYASMNA